MYIRVKTFSQMFDDSLHTFTQHFVNVIYKEESHMLKHFNSKIKQELH